MSRINFIWFGQNGYPNPIAKARLRINPKYATWSRAESMVHKWECSGGKTTVTADTAEKAWQKWALDQEFSERMDYENARRKRRERERLRIESIMRNAESARYSPYFGRM